MSKSSDISLRYHRWTVRVRARRRRVTHASWSSRNEILLKSLCVRTCCMYMPGRCADNQQVPWAFCKCLVLSSSSYESTAVSMQGFGKRHDRSSPRPNTKLRKLGGKAAKEFRLLNPENGAKEEHFPSQKDANPEPLSNTIRVILCDVWGPAVNLPLSTGSKRVKVACTKPMPKKCMAIRNTSYEVQAKAYLPPASGISIQAKFVVTTSAASNKICTGICQCVTKSSGSSSSSLSQF